jgi:hypothetical protein
MTDRPDPDVDFDALLRAANPVDETRLRAPQDSPRAQFLFEKITGIAYSGSSASRPSRSKRARFYLAGIVAVAAAGGGISYALSDNQPTQQVTAACYAADSLTADRTVVEVTGAGAVQDCAAAWSAGEIAGQGPETPPPLQACVLSTGTAGVFPDRRGDATACAGLGLPAVTPPPPGNTTSPSPTTPPSRTTPPLATTPGTAASPKTASTPPSAPPTSPVPSFVAANATIVTRLAASCVDETDAKAIVRDALDGNGLSNWTVQVTVPFTSARPCASPSFDQSTDIFYIVPIPPSGPQPGNQPGG